MNKQQLAVTPLFKVSIKIDSLLRKFIINGSVELEVIDETSAHF